MTRRNRSALLAERMRGYLSRADCPFPRQLLVFGSESLTEIQRRGTTIEDFSRAYLAEFPEHAIPTAFYYYSFYGVDYWPARRRIAEIFNLKSHYVAVLDEQILRACGFFDSLIALREAA